MIHVFKSSSKIMLAIVMLLASVCHAGGYVTASNGFYTNGDGWYYRGWIANGCWHYERASLIPVVTPNVTPPTYKPGWRAAYFEYLTQKADIDSYNATVAATSPVQPRDIIRPNGSYLSSYSSGTTFGYVGQTVGQYNQRSTSVDWNLVLGDIGRSEDHQADNLATAHGLRGDLARDLRLAEIARDRQIATQQALINAGSQPVQTQTRATFTSQQQTEQPQSVPQQSGSKGSNAATDSVPAAALAMQKIIATSCVSCHGGASPKAKFDVFKSLTSGTEQDFQAAAKKISDKVTSGAMPIDAQGTAHPLAPDRVKAIQDGLTALGWSGSNDPAEAQ